MRILTRTIIMSLPAAGY